MTCAPILSLGSINADFVCRVEDEVGSADLLVAREFTRFSGGKALNRAWLAKRLGHPAFLFGRVGDDDLADQALGAATACGVDTSGVTVARDSATAVAMVMVPPSGKKQIVFAENANLEWDEDGRAAIRSYGAGTVLTLDWEVPSDLVARALELAAELDMRVVGDPSPASKVERSLLHRLAAISANHSEAGELAEMHVGNAAQGRKAAEALRKCGVGLVCVRLEDGGVVVGERDTFHVIPPWEVDVVDTTGAGDAFAAALAAGLARGWPGLKAAALGNAAASVATTGYGSQVEALAPDYLFEIVGKLVESARPA